MGRSVSGGRAGPLVSVVIPTCERLPLLRQAIRSVQEQTFADLEIVVVDDASRDGTSDWLEAEHEPRMRSIRRTVRGGRLGACAAGLAEATGEFVMFLDDDDRLRPDALDVLVQPLRENPDAVAAVGAKWRYRDWGDGVRIHHVRRRHVGIVWPELLFGWSPVSGQLLFRTAAVRAAGGFPDEHPIVDDRWLCLRVARLGPMVLEPRVVLDYRVHDGPSRPADIVARREAVWAAFVSLLPRDERERGIRIRAAAASAERGDDALRSRMHRAALAHYVRACRQSPELCVSPLVGPQLRLGLRKAIAGVVAGTRIP
jgi:glycosyltransferase involved in cell wall biosynthesis